MKVLDPGHVYQLNTLDGDESCILKFVKREGPKFPGNVGHHCGTTLQEVLRACIERMGYVNDQTACAETEAARDLVRAAIVLLELRAARRHGHTLGLKNVDAFVCGDVCATCGHIDCKVHR